MNTVQIISSFYFSILWRPCYKILVQFHLTANRNISQTQFSLSSRDTACQHSNSNSCCRMILRYTTGTYLVLYWLGVLITAPHPIMPGPAQRVERTAIYMLGIFLLMDLVVRNMHKKFSAYIAECYKTKSQHLPKQTPENIVLCIYVEIVKILSEEVETAVSRSLRLPFG